MNFDDGVQFDPGFIQHISAFMPNIDYVYETLNRYRNFAQKKQQFKMFYPKIKSLLENYLGFYLGCILWAVYIKQFENKELLNNICFGGEYSEEETLSEVDFITNYIEQLKKDVKYYTGQNFSFDTTSINILAAYREFLKENKEAGSLISNIGKGVGNYINVFLNSKSLKSGIPSEASKNFRTSANAIMDKMKV